MTKSDNLCQYLCSCFSPSPTSSSSSNRRMSNNHKTHTVKKRLSTSLRDDIPDDHHHQEKTKNQEDIEEGEEEETRTSSTDESVNNYHHHQVNNPPRSSKSMVIGTFFGHRRGHVCFCIQYDRLNSKPSLLLQFSLPTYPLIKEMKCGLVRIALESCNNHRNASDNNNNNNSKDDVRRNSTSSVLPLLSIPIWTMCINGRKVGFASRRRTTDKDRLVLKTMKSMTVGAGVIPSGSLVSSTTATAKCDHHQNQEGGGEDGDVIYMRANYERVIGNIDSESFHLINPDGFSGQELSIFLLRSR
ncbi:protein MIZU-KUSSEI 1-like [Papaver somniferum]|nr:protein MIZU-KUSSEI 1-like [Papaver somniferum]